MNRDLIFQGSIGECLEKYDATLPKERALLGNARKAIRDFVGVTDDRISRILHGKGKTLPMGEGLIRLKYFLWLKGYREEQLAKLSPPIFQLGVFFAFSLITLQRIKSEVGYFTIDTFNKLLKGEVPSAQKEWNITEFVKKLEAEKGDELERLGRKFQTIRELPEKSTATSAANTAITIPKDVVLTSLASMIDLMIPLAELLDSDLFTDEERWHWRQAIAAKGAVFQLSNLLTRLCSREARNSKRRN